MFEVRFFIYFFRNLRLFFRFSVGFFIDLWMVGRLREGSIFIFFRCDGFFFRRLVFFKGKVYIYRLLVRKLFFFKDCFLILKIGFFNLREEIKYFVGNF